MKPVKLISAVLFFSLAIPLFGERIKNPYLLPPGTESSSYSHHALSALINPVFSDEDSSPFLSYSYVTNEDSDKSNHLFSLNIFGINLVYGKYGYLYDNINEEIIEEDADFFNINTSFLVRNIFGLGAGITFTNGHDQTDPERLFNFGFLLRPTRYFSLGYSVRDIDIEDNETYTGYIENYSLSLRPFRPVVLSLSADKFSEDSYSDMDYKVSLEIETYRGIKIRGGGGSDGYYSLSASMPFDLSSSNSTLGLDYHYTTGNNSGMKQSGPSIYFLNGTKRNSMNRSYNRRMVYLRINESIEENSQSYLLTERKMNFEEVLRTINRIAHDENISSLFIEIDNADLGMGQIQELRESIKRVKKQNKKVYAQLNKPGNREYYIASAADKISLTPGSGFYITGLSAQVYFIKSLLDKGGIKFESIRYGKYKSLNETYTRNKMSPELRENLESILNNMNSQFIDTISSDRKLSKKKIENLFNRGFYTPREAIKAGFIDQTGYSENLIAKVHDREKIVTLENYFKEKIISEGWGPAPSIAIVHVSGTIVNGMEGSPSASMTADKNFTQYLDRAFRTSNAVIIRIDSGGGSATASDHMFNAIHSMKRKYKKPIIFSFGNTAASGGYYIACTGDKIFANSGTITGSIGVIAGKISLKRLYEKIGINKEVIKLSPYADIFNEARDLTENERKVLQKSINFFYKRFTSIVMNGRKISSSKIDSVTQGRVFTGEQALNNRLTDINGGLISAIEFAKARTGMTGDVRILHLPVQESLVPLPGFMSAEMSSMKKIMKTLKKAEALNKLDGSSNYIQPYYIKIK